MLSVYPAIFTQSKSGGYSVVFPDLNHLATCGDDMQEAMEMAVDCLAGYLFTEKLDGNEIPTPTPLEKVDPHCEDIEELMDDVAQQFVNVVSVDVEAYAAQHFSKAVKRTVSIPQWLNNRAVAAKLNVSKVLQNALMKELHIAHANV
ncbi:MAG: type II toxin-antitoxin system HicB family antitoxin [Schwartzia sp.]|nr:type II toxin-antitoxin system HicB family antitoxin [Schwartzia sp. (in: firmicutes)]